GVFQRAQGNLHGRTPAEEQATELQQAPRLRRGIVAGVVEEREPSSDAHRIEPVEPLQREPSDLLPQAGERIILRGPDVEKVEQAFQQDRVVHGAQLVVPSVRQELRFEFLLQQPADAPKHAHGRGRGWIQMKTRIGQGKQVLEQVVRVEMELEVREQMAGLKLQESPDGFARDGTGQRVVLAPVEDPQREAIRFPAGSRRGRILSYPAKDPRFALRRGKLEDPCHVLQLVEAQLARAGIVPVAGEGPRLVVERERLVAEARAIRILLAENPRLQGTPPHREPHRKGTDPQAPGCLIRDLARAQMPHCAPEKAGRRTAHTFRGSPVATDSRIRNVARVVLTSDSNGMGSPARPRAASRKAASSASKPLSIPEVLCRSRLPPRAKVVTEKSSQRAMPRAQKTSMISLGSDGSPLAR